MTSTSGVPEGVARLDEATRAAERLVAGITADQWHSPTSCEEFDVLGVVEHMVTGLEQFADVGLGKPLDIEAEGSFNTDQADDHYREASTSIVAAWSAPGAVDREYDMPWGATPGWALVDFMTIEEITHGWDIARATGQKSPFDAALVEKALELARQYDDESIRVPGMFGPAVPAPDGAGPFDRLAAFLGREV